MTNPIHPLHHPAKPHAPRRRRGWPAGGVLRVIAICLASTAAIAAAQTTQPASDATVDWLLTTAKSVPATQATSAPAEPAVSPFAPRSTTEALTATITFSDDTTLQGPVTTTEGKPIRIWDEALGEYRDVPLRLIKSFEAQVLWERDEPEWKFIESGSDIKEFTGRTYPARELIYTVTLVNDQTIRGGIVAPLYFQAGNGTRTLVLHKRQKGEVGQSLEALKYLKRVDVSHADTSQE